MRAVKLAIIGATGFVGSPVLERALACGHEVTAIGRSTGRLGSRPGLTEVSVDIQDADRVGQVADPDRLSRVVADHDMVISCFNPGHDLSVNPNLYRDVIEGTRVIIDSVRRSGVRRLLYVGGGGSLRSPNGKAILDDTEWVMKVAANRPPQMWMPPGPPVLDIPRGVRIALYLFQREHEMDWIFFSPSMYLGDFGGGTGQVRYGLDELLLNEAGEPATLDVKDLAVAIIDQVEQPQGSRIHLTAATV